MNLETILFTQGFGSRRQCRALIGAGAVRIGAAVRTDPGADFDTAGLTFDVENTSWLFREKAYLMLYKPGAYECSRQPQHHASVFSLLPPPLLARGVQCVGRLDQDTTGLLLLSDDGSFMHALASPKKKVPKIYVAGLRHPLDEAQLQALRDGVLLHGETQPSCAAAARALDAHTLELTIAEGKYHQVKRMVAAAGNRVETLHRRAVGALTLPPGLAPGQWCWLDERQLGQARSAGTDAGAGDVAGGPAQLPA
ncbi:16S rRNA pseudouridine(516) synthase [Robbsia sp. Bb-Pol-6]|uniref:Pseudouridine synthase n=1 Tax=Robbsia betulipollinis TaxID=2981849 RepID=A0ABT3ZQB5_9BURK|nr:16S rRNA pseudouridine(516) synthase [Robbsia betulipollinis]MCY0388754.1 16S rRNA pseudouridine(516) synthase [Robbsia betulipollinis]